MKRKYEVHHDYRGWYIVAPDEERDEAGYGPDGVSLGFDGRQHYETEAAAWANCPKRRSQMKRPMFDIKGRYLGHV